MQIRHFLQVFSVQLKTLNAKHLVRNINLMALLTGSGLNIDSF